MDDYQKKIAELEKRIAELERQQQPFPWPQQPQQPWQPPERHDPWYPNYPYPTGPNWRVQYPPGVIYCVAR